MIQYNYFGSYYTVCKMLFVTQLLIGGAEPKIIQSTFDLRRKTSITSIVGAKRLASRSSQRITLSLQSQTLATISAFNIP